MEKCENNITVKVTIKQCMLMNQTLKAVSFLVYIDNYTYCNNGCSSGMEIMTVAKFNNEQDI